MRYGATFSVKEYEKIFSDFEYFDELIKFTAASEFLTFGWQKGRGAFVQAKNYVGVIRLPSGFQLEILPKIDAPKEKLRELVINMLRSLKEFPYKKFLNANLDTARLNLYEIFIRIYLEMVLDLVKRGLKSSYVVHEENLNYFKGKLLVNENLRRNSVHKEKFFVSYDEYSLNRPEHRLIKATLIKILHTTTENKHLANRLLAEFETVEQSINYRRDFDKVFIDKQNREYKTVIGWTKIFLRGKTFTSFTSKSETLALMFNMERLFEEFIAEHVRKIFPKPFNVKIQAREKFLFDAPKSYGLKPDIIIEHGNEIIILDTKWKFKISADDMYQMFVYAKKYKSTKIFLLCPPNKEKISLYKSTNDGFNVKIFCVDLFNVVESLSKLSSE